ncbi:bifunctional aldehyde dehydrogenase/enoyl-CoA hydratase [Variovorax sp. SRS16]|uniref:MaoC family dehydratase n=1 Tax=Variovorax sp. SRS16 TaxID=282217 RepID=UPI0013181576|nr:acyl dehydratase [Variovorax sp. SRS16]VTU26148.1 bifunctional aldehyde dehydrogenase/enoyl-CoA hydratase [Variovorax sp. SRS16]
MEPSSSKVISLETGPWWDDLVEGGWMRSRRRTVTEADLVQFVNLSWLNEELFTVAGDRPGMAIQGRVVPAALVYSFAEGLMMPSLQAAGLAFLGTTLDIKAPTRVGDTLHVQCEVIERRTSSKPGRGLVRTRNDVVNQRGETVLVYEPLRLMRMRAA